MVSTRHSADELSSSICTQDSVFRGVLRTSKRELFVDIVID